MADNQIIIVPPSAVDVSAMPLLADLQFLEPSASEGINRKFFGVIPPGIYRGFKYSLPGGMVLRIGLPSEAGTIVVQSDSTCITVQQRSPVDVVVPAGFVGYAVLTGFYKYGVPTKQVSATALKDAAKIELVAVESLQPNQVILYSLNVPAGAVALTDPMVSLNMRQDISIAVKADIYQLLTDHINSPTAHTKAQVGLSNLNNWGATASVNDPSNTTYATAGAVKITYDLAAAALPKAGGTLTGSLYGPFFRSTGADAGISLVPANQADPSYIRSSPGGVNSWYVGKGGSSDQVMLYNYRYDTLLSLLSDRVSTNRPLYDNTGRAYTTGNKPTAADVAALPISGGNLTGPLGVQTINGQGSSGTWGSLDVTGVKGGWSGFNFTSIGYWFGVNTAGLSGVFDSAGNPKWYFEANGQLGGGATVRWGSITGHPDRNTWASLPSLGVVVGQLAWKHYGTGHTIFDASAGTSPDGTAVDKNNSQIAWRSDNAAYPTLMGWNGVNTYGVRVDSSRRADGAGWADGAAYANKLDGDVITTIGRDLRFYGKRAMVGKDNNDGNQLVINYNNDFGSTAIQGDLYAGTIQSSRHAIIHNGATNYANAGLDVRSTDGSEVRIAMHRLGYSAGAIVHNSWGFTFERETAGSNGNVGAGNFFANDAQSVLGNALTRLDYVGANFLKYRHRLMTDDGTSIDNVSREYGFNYQTGGGVFGPYISFGGMEGRYDCQINADYGTGNEIRFRTRNGDANLWNPWHSFWNTGNFDPNSKLNTIGGTITGPVYNAVNGVPNTFVGGKLSSESGTLSLDAYTYAFVTSPNDAHLCFNAHYQPSTGWQKYDNARPSGHVVINAAGLQYLHSDSGVANVGQYVRNIYHTGNLDPIAKNTGNVLNNPGFGVGFLSSGDSGAQWIAGYFGKNGGSNQVVIGEVSGSAVIGAHPAAKTSWADLYIGCAGAGGGGNNITHISMPYARVQGNATSYEIFHRGMFNPDAENRFVARGDAADCNTAVANGHYRLTPSTANMPSATYGCMFTVSEGWGVGNAGAWLQQTAYMHDGTIWTRRSVNGGWAGWTRLWDSAGFNPDSKLSNNGAGGTLTLSDWFRSTGASGWYNETYQGGIYMDEPTTIKIHNGKKFYTANTEYNAIAATGGIFSYQRFMVDTRQQIGNGGSFQAYRYIDAPFHAGHGGLDVNSFAPIVGSANYTNGQGYTTRIQLGALTPGGTGWSSAALMVGSAENNAHPLATFIFSADGSMSGITGISLTGNITIGNDMICSYAYANGAQPQVGNALTRKDYVDARDYAMRWETQPVIQHGGGDANAHYNSAWDGANVANAPVANWCFFRELYHSGGSNWRHQEAFEFFTDEEWFRRGQNQAGDYGPWRRRWHSGNFDPASKSDVGHGHAISAIDGLQNALDSKAPNGHTHWRLAANGTCSIAMANHATGTYRATIDTGVAPAHNFVHDANKYRVVLHTNNINTGSAGTCTWGAYGVVRALSKWSGGSSMQIDVYSFGTSMNAGTIYSWELWEIA